MKKFLEKVPYLIFSFFLFIILPLCSYFISNKSGMIILLLIILYPVISFLISFLYAYNKEDFSYIFSFIIGIFYIISCLIILNFDILIYGLGYIFFSLCGQGIGFLIGKLRKSKKRAKQSQLNSKKKGLYTKSGAWKNSSPGFQFLYTKRQISNIIKVYKNN